MSFCQDKMTKIPCYIVSHDLREFHLSLVSARGPDGRLRPRFGSRLAQTRPTRVHPKGALIILCTVSFSYFSAGIL